MLITRRVDFSASHRCYHPALSEEQNRALYGEAANPHGHGHNYAVEVTLEGEPDPVTGMVFDLKRLKEILEREVVGPMDHRFLNHEVPPFDRVAPTAENLAIEIWRRVEPHLDRERARLHAVRVYETEDLFADYFGEGAAGADEETAGESRITRRYRFSAAHRLHSERLSEAENRETYGKCSNPRGHGHDYVLEVSVRAPVESGAGRGFPLAALDALVRQEVLSAFHHKNLNVDVPDFAGVVPTTENLALNIRERLARRWSAAFPAGRPQLEKLRVRETKRNTFDLPCRPNGANAMRGADIR